MNVNVHWEQIRPDYEEPFYWSGVVYAYTDRKASELLYLGKATTTTVWERWKARDKQVFWRSLEAERRMYGHQVFVGVLEIPEGRRFSRELLSDVESLLIYNLEPWGNIQARYSRIERPGMTVRCLNEWPHRRRVFRDY